MVAVTKQLPTPLIVTAPVPELTTQIVLAVLVLKVTSPGLSVLKVGATTRSRTNTFAL